MPITTLNMEKRFYFYKLLRASVSTVKKGYLTSFKLLLTSFLTIFVWVRILQEWQHYFFFRPKRWLGWCKAESKKVFNLPSELTHCQFCAWNDNLHYTLYLRFGSGGAYIFNVNCSIRRVSPSAASNANFLKEVYCCVPCLYQEVYCHVLQVWFPTSQ